MADEKDQDQSSEYHDPVVSHHDEGAEEASSAKPYTIKKITWSKPRLILVGVVTAVVLLVLFIAIRALSGPDGPTLESRVQDQHQVINQLLKQVNELKSDLDERNSQAQGTSNRLGELTSRIDDLEQNHITPELEKLPAQVGSLSDRLDELSSSVDVRFNAAQEKQQSIESSIEGLRQQQASQKKSAAQVSQPKTQPQKQHEPEPPTPPFSVSGIEMRGGRSYLAIDSGTGRLSGLRLVSEGQNIGQWHLTSIDGRSAKFTVNDQAVTVPVP
ncbi:hypothetical protein [Kushneria indalinina]|uniref:Uncharacterized protein n=1 Tax=Kushneria indalinina DSM 14324 TaxID=1122140 RepID=A0A3D9DRR0_9GAMM|nr:hypothetical protein [Kushneria indalinina]REC93351.1 hypothetical protein C8D72_3395 [Kushneria indalinina DSM 14324]